MRRRLAAFCAASVVVMGAGSVAARPALRGVVEGYYGRPWTGEARRDVIRFLGARGMNAFLYAPKNDDFHRMRWREPYPASELADLRLSAAAARDVRVKFIYGLSPVLDVCYACDADFDALTAKLAQVAGAGVRRFALLFDDGGALRAPEDVARYGGTDTAALARAQADLTNRTQRWLRRHRRELALIVPSDYAGTRCHPYHQALAPALHRGIPVGWTGPGVFAATITATQARDRADCMPGHPVVLWDNYPVNDTFLANNLHLGPFTGRDPELPRALAGYLVNPMTQAHASMVALGTAAAYLADPKHYVADDAWNAILADLGGGGTGLAVLAAQVRSSSLDLDDALALAAAVDGMTATYPTADWPADVDALATEEMLEAAAPADIAARLGGTPLGEEIAPWVDELAAHVARGTDAVRLFRAMKPDFADLRIEVGDLIVHATGRALAPDVATAAALGPGLAAEAVAVAARIAGPPFPDYFDCLGDLQGADIHFCPQFGLNVHGKMLYVIIRMIPQIFFISDRNVHERLVLLAGGSYTEWAARQGDGSAMLTLTADGAPVPLAADGTFDVTRPAPSGMRLVLATAAGDATARVVP